MTQIKYQEKELFTTFRVYEKIVAELKLIPGINWSIQQYNYLYIVHRILTHATLSKGENNGCKINQKHLAILFSKSNQKVAQMFFNLKKWGIIYKSGLEKIGVNSASYKIAEGYDNNNILLITVSSYDVCFINKLITLEDLAIKENPFINKSLDILKSYIKINNDGVNYLKSKYNIEITNNNNNNNNNNISILPIDGYGQNEYRFFVSKTQFFKQNQESQFVKGVFVERSDLALISILRGRFFCVRPNDKNGKKSRVYNNLTSLPREHRKYISFNDKPLLMTDISNSQILLTVPVIEKYYKIHSGKGIAGVPDDVVQFKRSAESGKFYENFYNMFGPGEIDGDDRVFFKKEIFRSIWFGRTKNHSFTKIKKVFWMNYPNVYEVIKKLKFNDYTQFSIGLQQFEAEIMIDNVAAKMLKNRRTVLTLHDAIVTYCQEDLDEAERLITKAMSKHGITPQFKRETISLLNDSEPSTSLKKLDEATNDYIQKTCIFKPRSGKPVQKKHFSISQEGKQITTLATPKECYAKSHDKDAANYSNASLNSLYDWADLLF